MIDLADCHKEVLRTLVKLRREGAIDDEFTIFQEAQNGQLIHSGRGRLASRASGRLRIINADGLTPLALEALTRSNFLFSIVHNCRDTVKDDTDDESLGESQYEFESSRDCYITPAGFRAVDSNFAAADDIVVQRPPVEITANLAKFKEDIPDPSRLAFVMMQFGKSKAHDDVYAAIRNALDPHQFVALRADSKEYHQDLWWNVLTYIYGCRFGIAVFERIEDDVFNPNVSLEVGYMTGIGKPVCHLKERTVRTLHTDLAGRLYKEFDLQSCDTTIQPALWKWMTDKGLMVQQLERQEVESQTQS